MVVTVKTLCNYTFHFVCCGRRYDFKTVWERNQSRKIHNKTLKHKINQAVADSWIKRQKFQVERMKRLEDALIMRYSQ